MCGAALLLSLWSGTYCVLALTGAATYGFSSTMTRSITMTGMSSVKDISVFPYGRLYSQYASLL